MDCSMERTMVMLYGMLGQRVDGMLGGTVDEPLSEMVNGMTRRITDNSFDGTLDETSNRVFDAMFSGFDR